MRKLTIFLLVFGLVLLPATIVAQQDEMPDADGAALREYVTETSPYTEWEYLVNEDGGMYFPSESPHGPVVAVFLNDVAAGALHGRGESMMMDEEAMMEDFPYGSIIVKEGYQTEGATVEEPGELTAITVMYKVEGYDPEHNDWFWLRFPPEGDIVAEGMVEGCINCHSAEGNFDYTLFGFDGEFELSGAMPDADGAALREYVTETSPYTEWSYLVNEDGGMYFPSESPHGPVVAVFLNGIAAEAVAGAGEMMEMEAFPYGSIIVKEGYQTEGATVEEPGELTAITAMYKVEGYDPEHNDWFWLRFPPEGDIVAEGMVEGCINCHSAEGNFDYTLFGFPQDVELELMELPEADGAALMEYILETNPYTEWFIITGKEGAESEVAAQFMESASPHGELVRVYINDVLLNSIMDAGEDFSGPLPYGSIIVKEGYPEGTMEDPGELGAVTVMYKVEGFNPEAGDWFWAMAPGGELGDSGALEMCIDCHSGEGNFDYMLILTAQ